MINERKSMLTNTFDQILVYLCLNPIAQLGSVVSGQDDRVEPLDDCGKERRVSEREFNYRVVHALIEQVEVSALRRLFGRNIWI